MYILGIKGGPNTLEQVFVKSVTPSLYHDSSAVLLHDGVVIAAFEEERLNRIKHSNLFPVQSINACLATAGISIDDIDFIAYGGEEEVLNELVREHYPEWRNGRSFLHHIFQTHTGFRIEADKIRFFHHHFAHAASAYFSSGYDRSLVATFDGAGDQISGSIYSFQGNRYDKLEQFSIDDSLGFFYLRVTLLLGFNIFDEYKVMGLAPYGDPTVYEEEFSKFYTLLPDGKFRIFQDKMEVLSAIIPPRKKGEPILSAHKNIAASLQHALETILNHVLENFRIATGQQNLCLAGGVALNGTATGKFLTSGSFSNIYICPASGDDGLSLGAGLACYYTTRKEFAPPLMHAYWGTSLNSERVAETIQQWKDFVHSEHTDSPSDIAADLLAKGAVIGWFQGRTEFGARALGNRSILADPRPPENKNRVNAKIKLREGFRPFAPSILEEYANEFFEVPENTHASAFAYMTFVLKVRERYRDTLGAVTHVDGTARLQTVSKLYNPGYWKLIEAFRQRTGVPVVLNTSFNNNFEPIVDSPEDALVCFLTNELDYLILGNHIVKKHLLSRDHFRNKRLVLPQHIVIRRRDAEIYLFDKYLNRNIMVSNALGEFLEVNQNKLLLKGPDDNVFPELLNLWSERIIRISPSSNVPVSLLV